MASARGLGGRWSQFGQFQTVVVEREMAVVASKRPVVVTSTAGRLRSGKDIHPTVLAGISGFIYAGAASAFSYMHIETQGVESDDRSTS